MPDFLKLFGATEGPLGFPLADKQARAVDALLKTLPKGKEYEYRHAVKAQAPTELNPGERSDVSWITTESVDRTQEVVIAKGMDNSQFIANPLVTLGHAYFIPPVGKSLWQKRTKDGPVNGIKAKTQYPAQPGNWPQGDPWPPDQVFSLVQAGLMQGKSIGFLPTAVHFADPKEAQKNGWPEGVMVFDSWLLLEYACCFLPVNQDALVEQVSKGLTIPPDLLKAMGLPFPLIFENKDEGGRMKDEKESSDSSFILHPSSFQSSPIIGHTTTAEVEKYIVNHLRALNMETMVKKVVQDAFDRARGRV